MTYNPARSGELATLDELREYMRDEFDKISKEFNEMIALDLRSVHAEPGSPREGMIASADGTNWNPGSGAGSYEYVSGAWRRLFATAPANFVGDSGAGGVAGLVPAPAAGDAAANKFLKASGGWVTPVADAPVDALYLTLAANATLTVERIITAGAGIVFVDAGAGGALTITPDIATQAEQETGSSVSKLVTSGRQHFHPGSLKAWVKFDPTGAIAGTPYNIPSVTDNGVGDWSVNIGTDFSSANYAASGIIGTGSATDTCVLQIAHAADPTAGVFRVNSIDPFDGTAQDPADPAMIMLMFAGDQA